MKKTGLLFSFLLLTIVSCGTLSYEVQKQETGFPDSTDSYRIVGANNLFSTKGNYGTNSAWSALYIEPFIQKDAQTNEIQKYGFRIKSQGLDFNPIKQVNLYLKGSPKAFNIEINEYEIFDSKELGIPMLADKIETCTLFFNDLQFRQLAKTKDIKLEIIGNELSRTYNYRNNEIDAKFFENFETFYLTYVGELD